MTDQSARQRILERLRKPATDASVAMPDLIQPRRSCDQSPKAQLIQALKDNHITVHDTQHADWTESLKTLATNLKQKHWCLGMGEAGLPALAALESLKYQGITVQRFNARIENFKDPLFDTVEVGLSMASYALADTGTLVIESSANEPRSLSLVPEVSVILVDSNNILLDLNSYLEKAELGASRSRSNTILISSPSKTADIQQTLAYGAHGPRSVHAILF